MAVRSRKNQYVGVNAHLHSRLQNIPAGWEIFHGNHVTHLGEAIYKLLPPGYVVDTERSMQIREYHPATGEPIVVKKPRRPQPDIVIASSTASVAGTKSSSLLSASTPTLLLPAIETIGVDEEIYLTAIVIRETGNGDEIGEPVAWIELLSPTNKLGSGAFQYIEKRFTALRSGIVMVELDYLHQTPSPFEILPSYPDREKGAYPYSAIVTDPRPTLQDGETKVYGFEVEQKMPIIVIPLSGEDKIVLDLGTAYNYTYESTNSYSARVDYEQEPEHFDSYSPADQERIRRRMRSVQQYQQWGMDLEQGPFALLEG
ncbi:MAG: DUF4058 family protein [Anaerolineae bacterium]